MMKHAGAGAAVLALAVVGAHACTYSGQPVGDDEWVQARTIQYVTGAFADPETLVPNLDVAVFPRGTSRVQLLSDDREPEVVSNEFAFVSTGKQLTDELRFDGDGFNEAGLSVSALELDETRYPAAGSGGDARRGSVSRLEAVNWMLGHFDSVDALVREIRNRTAISQCPGELQQICELLPALHYTISDRTQRSVVIEYLEGEAYIYENTVHTLTNDPPFEFQVRNLGTYRSVHATFGPTDAAGKLETEQDLEARGIPMLLPDGATQFGIPGDASSTSRFVRTFFQRMICERNRPPTSVAQALEQQMAIVDGAMLPYGWTPGNAEQTQSYTLSSYLKVPTRGLFMFRTYANNQWQQVDLRAALARADGQVLRMNMPDLPHFGFRNATEDLLA